ncbi:unnamed protein product [Prunus armeniaca]|uniref:TBCC domain-containing protein 1 n=1 Tax=Prunus armeniaca TaxID=36596 RepID=A0A6J5VD25_PRUAR|nr:unnamed protein product [Prunus armeniaca]
MSDPIEPSTSSSSTKDPALLIHPRREPFEHGLLPIPKLIFTDPTQTLIPLKQKLIEQSSSHRVNSAAISEVLQISIDHARLVLDTLASVLHSESDPLLKSKPDVVDEVGADVNDLVLFLYIQSYKKLLPRTHKDSAAVADVWPSTSAFDGYLSALSPLQLVRSNSRRFVPSQADEEAHQLSYLQKHLANIVSLLAEPVEGEGEESLKKFLPTVSTTPSFNSCLGSEGYHLGQYAPFFANSDPDMPAVPVPAAQVHDWVLQNIVSSLENISERISPKENGPPSSSDQDVPMADACTSTNKGSISVRGPSFIEGISKSSLIKQASDLKALLYELYVMIACCMSPWGFILGHSWFWAVLMPMLCFYAFASPFFKSVVYREVLNCHDSVIYILAPLRYATVYGCSDATIVLGAVGKAVRIEHCERVHVITAAKRICIANCRECMFFLGVNQRPLIVGDNHKLQVAPYNTFYGQLEEHMNEVGIDATINRWNEPLALGVVDPHDSLSHPAGVSDAQAESGSHLDPEQFTNFLIPNWYGGESEGSTKDNPFPLPDIYVASQQRNQNNLGEVKQLLREAPLEENRKRELSTALHVYFKDWLYASGNIRQLIAFKENDFCVIMLWNNQEWHRKKLSGFIFQSYHGHLAVSDGATGRINPLYFGMVPCIIMH